MREEEGLYGCGEEAGGVAIIPIEKAAREPCKAEAHDVKIGIIVESQCELYFTGGFLECRALRYQKLGETVVQP